MAARAYGAGQLPRPIARLPRNLESVTALLKRRNTAAQRKSLWVNTYSEAYRYTMPQRESFFSPAEGQRQGRDLYDSTAADAVITSANVMQNNLCPAGREWGQLVPGSEIDDEQAKDPEVQEGMQKATDTFFAHLQQSNFDTVVNETFLDIQVGTGSLRFDEGEDPIFLFSSMPLSAVELEEGPWGEVCTIWSTMDVEARNVPLMWKGYQPSNELAQTISRKPETKVRLVVGQVYDHPSRHYFGVVIEEAAKHIGWRYDYGDTGPVIAARALVKAGELYGRGPILAALPDIRTLNAMVEDLLRYNKLQLAPPFTGVSDGVVNPYTVNFAPLTVIPVSSNATANPSLRVLETGANFNFSRDLLMDLRESVRRKLTLDHRRKDGPVESAFEVAVEDRELLNQRGAMYGRVRGELLAKIVQRGVAILRRRGKIAPVRIDGREVSLKYRGPLARAQDHDDILVLDRVMGSCAALGPEITAGGLKVEDIPGWVARRAGLDATLVRSPTEQKQIKDLIASFLQQQAGGAK